MLKRKNEEDVNGNDNTKRVALDAEVDVEAGDSSAVVINNGHIDDDTNGSGGGGGDGAGASDDDHPMEGDSDNGEAFQEGHGVSSQHGVDEEGGVENGAVDDGNGRGSNGDALTQALSVNGKKYPDDPTYVCFRMLCLAKEAGLIVGKRGETINHIKSASGARLQVSENIKDVVERVVFVKGSAENVAKAFGLIVRAIVGEEEDRPSSAESHPYDLRLLVPNNAIGYVIGKQGSRFREIEEDSAAVLSAESKMMPFSTDRCLTIRGVADAVHIAVYYVAQTILGLRPLRGDVIFYDPVKAELASKAGVPSSGVNGPGGLRLPGIMPTNVMGYTLPAALSGQHYTQAHFNGLSLQSGSETFQSIEGVNSAVAGGGGGNGGGVSSAGFINPLPISLPLDDAKITHELYIPNDYVGNVIGKMGKTIKSIKEQSGSNVIIGDPEAGSSQRRVTIVGNAYGNQTAIYLINNRINMDKKANDAKARLKEQQHQQAQQTRSETQINET